jgi:uncharacterized RDD family membrane protein YckC
MNMRDTRSIMRANTAALGTAPARRSTAGRPARVWLRMIAYIVDWLVMVIVGSILVSIGGIQLYLASDRGTQNPPDGSVYAFLAISLLALPVWLVMTFAGWSMGGRSVGKLAAGLRIVDTRGGRPGSLRGLVRLAVYVLENAPLVLAPAVLAIWLAADSALPGWAVSVAAGLLLAAVAALFPALLSSGGRPLHDLAAGTSVVEE